MVIVKLMGGLGNQMFQYAAGRALAARNHSSFKIDISPYRHQAPIDTPREYALNVFNIREEFSSLEENERVKRGLRPTGSIYWQRIKRLFGMKETGHIVESKFSFNQEVLTVNKDAYLDGYWQTQKYFNDIEDIIRKEFTLKEEYSIGDLELIKEIKNSCAVSLHVRRGDYAMNPTTNQVHGLCQPEYYARAVSIVTQKVTEPHFFIFSDDIQWAKNNVKIQYPVRYVSDMKLNDYHELTLMSYCQHNIIANSSFSWWSAFLNENPRKIVIAPERWFADPSIDTSDLVPETWTRI